MPFGLSSFPIAIALALSTLAGCSPPEGTGIVVTFPGSAVGTEAKTLRLQLERFMRLRPDIRVVQRRTPDAADQRHQLYVQWLNAGAGDPDILQLDVVWTAEFAAAGWIQPLDRFEPDVGDFFAGAVAANRWRGTLYALPWFVDVGMLYWRHDLLPRPPKTIDDLDRAVASAVRSGTEPRYGLVWQGARYEGLVTVFVEYLGAFGGRILDDAGRVAVDSPEAVLALAAMRRQIERHIVPTVALTWHEEETRFAFQNGQALFMRNWPYAHSLMEDTGASQVAGRFSVAPMPAAAGGARTATLGGSQLAINANSDHPEAAYAVIEFLTRPEQMIERARLTGQYPPRRSLYDGDVLAGAISVPPAQAREIIRAAVPRPVTPVYTQLSELLQIRLHRALIGEEEPAAALAAAAREMRSFLERVGLAPMEG